jgi:hypothetical protein
MKLRWKKEYAIVLGLLLIVLAILGGYRLFRLQALAATPPPPSIVNPPIYPGAQQVKVEPRPSEFGPRITFETSDNIAQVLEYYNSLLSGEGWTPDGTSESPNSLVFSYGNGPYYGFAVKVEELSPNQMKVTLLLQSIPRID